MNFFENIILCTDSYKISHWCQYPPKTEFVYSYLEARKSTKEFPHVVKFGLGYLLKRYLAGQVVTKEKIDQAEEFCAAHFNSRKIFNRANWEYILEKHGGKLPVVIKSVPEGTVVPRGNIMLSVENTDPNCYWLTSYLETLLVQLWYPCTVATISREIKMIILNFLDRTGTPESVDFRLHDFGFRGVSSVETAAIGDAAHLVNFKGTDTIAGILLAQQYYGADMAGFSVPATEHSTMTSWGRDGEADAYANMLTQFPQGIVAVVSDSYDIKNAISEIWGKTLKEKVLERDGCLVIRPDSGTLPDSVVKILKLTQDTFGATANAKGFLELNPKVRIIQGDGIDLAMVQKILQAMAWAKFSADNITFGSGGGLLQKLNRDTLSFAFKCASVVVDGVQRDVFKSPVGDKKKASKAGRMKLIFDGKQFVTVKESSPGEDTMVEVFRDGEILQTWTFAEIRENAFVD